MIRIGKNERVLVVAAHPDDEALGCGGTIARFHTAGAAVRVVCLAEGITARHDPTQFDNPEVKAEIETRSANARRAMALLGVSDNEIFLDGRFCCRLDTVPQIDLTKEIETHARDFKPTVVLTHAGYDTNVDHGVVQRAALAAFRPYHFPGVRVLLAFEVLSSTEWNPTVPFHANYFIDIASTIDTKLKALLAYGSEMLPPPHPRSEEAVRGLARYRGAQAGMNWAEAFQTLRVMVP
jgi:LmbE family N-acetylglucosaminyl deacetylase